MVELKEVKTKSDLKAFVKFPFKLYKNVEYWVPPIIRQELKVFDKKGNPTLEHSDATPYLAYKHGEIVGRIAIIVNWLEVKEQRIKRLRFGWFDFIDDLEVSKVLFEKVECLGKFYCLDFAEGPMGFSSLDMVGGLITEGFDTCTPMAMWYNHPYYINHYKAHGYCIEKKYSESKFKFKSLDPTFFIKAHKLLKERYHLKSLAFNNTKSLMPRVDEMFELFNKSYASLSSFVPITQAQKEHLKKTFIRFINPEYIKFVVDKRDKLIAFAIVMPSFSEALQKANGLLFPLGYGHLLKAKKYSKDVVFYLIGVDPCFQKKGVHAVIFYEYWQTFKEKNIENCIRTPELEDNVPIQRIWKHFPSKVYRHRRTFKKLLQ